MKIKTQYVCQSCGYAASKWLGRCTGCEGWGTLVEEKVGHTSNREAALEAAGLHGALLNAGRMQWVGLEPEEGELPSQSSIVFSAADLFRIVLFCSAVILGLERARSCCRWRKVSSINNPTSKFYM
jgi:predicted ATP-dependent serine protease